LEALRHAGRILFKNSRLGPWSIRACGWIGLPAIHAVEGRSFVFEAPEVPAEALFLEHLDLSRGQATAEVLVLC
jgi:hypothetical protein